MDKFCMNCGQPLDEDSVFCENCGSKVNDTPQKQVIPTPPEQAVPIQSKQVVETPPMQSKLVVETPPMQSASKSSSNKKKNPLIFIILIVIVIGLITIGAMFAKNNFFGKDEAVVFETRKVTTVQAEKKSESASESNLLPSESEIPSESVMDESLLDTTIQEDEGLNTDGIDGIVDGTSYTIEELSGFWNGILTEYIGEEEFMEVNLELVFTPISSNEGTMTFISLGGSYIDGDNISPSEQISMDYTYNDGQLTFEIPEVGYIFEIVFFEDEEFVYGYGYTNDVDGDYYKIVLYR